MARRGPKSGAQAAPISHYLCVLIDGWAGWFRRAERVCALLAGIGAALRLVFQQPLHHANVHGDDARRAVVLDEVIHAGAGVEFE